MKNSAKKKDTKKTHEKDTDQSWKPKRISKLGLAIERNQGLVTILDMRAVMR